MANATDCPSPSPSSVNQDPPPPDTCARKPGGWRAVKYILGNESFEKLASMSLVGNLTVYLQSKYHIGGVFVVNIVSIWSGSSNIASLAGAFISDTYFGRFRTLLYGSIASLLGMGTMTLTAGIPQLRPPTCTVPTDCPQPKAGQFACLFAGLGLLAIGAGGIRPCNIGFGADQFDTKTAKGRAQLQSFFNWWYFSFTVSLVIALTIVVYIQTNVSWVLGFAIPTACFVVSITVFLVGCHTYILVKPQGSVFSDMARVITAALRKRRLGVGPESQFYDPPLITSDQSHEKTKLKRTNRFKFFDKAAIITDPSELHSQENKPKNGWRLCSVQQVEELKCFIAIFPVWVSGVLCFIPMDQHNTFGVLQALQMDRSIGSNFKIPPAWLNLVTMTSLSIWIFIYEGIYIPLSRKLTKKEKRLSMQQRIKIGMIMSILCMIVSGVVEKFRRNSALKHNNGSFVSPISVMFLSPQLVFSGLTEAFASVSIMEFFTMRMPESMRTVAGAIFFLSLSITSYTSALIVNIIHAATKNNERPWLGGHDLNKNRLEYYYFTIAALGTVNLLYFIFYASKYADLENTISRNSRNLSKSDSMDEEKGLERHGSN
ncbi:hypothetical protein QYF36_019430 [Acer negundo]|nr:hypothetical protein QYF36_019430 [Acer negundo]